MNHEIQKERAAQARGQRDARPGWRGRSPLGAVTWQHAEDAEGYKVRDAADAERARKRAERRAREYMERQAEGAEVSD